jgi:hypothetical protein
MESVTGRAACTRQTEMFSSVSRKPVHAACSLSKWLARPAAAACMWCYHVAVRSSPHLLAGRHRPRAPLPAESVCVSARYCLWRRLLRGQPVPRVRRVHRRESQGEHGGHRGSHVPGKVPVPLTALPARCSCCSGADAALVLPTNPAAGPALCGSPLLPATSAAAEPGAPFPLSQTVHPPLALL